MKYIIKDNEPNDFREWKENKNEDWTPKYENLRGKVKESVYSSLKNEQGHICCYCERKLETDDYHIEHLKPQKKFPESQLEYNNLLCSCQRDFPAGAPRHCGNEKGDWFDDSLLISPLDISCENRFKYTALGDILPTNENDSVASTTIKKLNLDLDKLNKLREKAIEPFIDETLTLEDIRNFTKGYLVDKTHNNGKFNEFYTTIKYLFS